MFVWHACIIPRQSRHCPATPHIILGYTMPIFSAVIGALLFSAVLSRRGWRASALRRWAYRSCWHEFTGLASKP